MDLRTSVLKRFLAGALCVVWLAGCRPAPSPTLELATSTSLPATATPSPTPLPSATPTVTPQPSPTAVPTATPFPALDPAALRALSENSLARVLEQARGASLLCLRYEDLDVDGELEWLALYHQTEPARLSALVLDGDEIYDLEPAAPKPGAAETGLGQYPVCEVEIRDINLDGLPEMAIFGHARGSDTLLHVFAWDGGRQAYRRLGFFSGDAAVRLIDADGDLEDEIWEGYRVQEAPELAWYVVYTWENHVYGWTSDRYDWYFQDRPHAYPTNEPDYAVISFYLALDDRDMAGAYRLLQPDNRPDYAAWALGYAATVRVDVGGVHRIPATSTGDRAHVAAMVTAWDNEAGVVVGRLWNVEWETVATGEGWRLLGVTTELLNEWTVQYWP